MVRVNPVLLGYDKECFLTIKHIDKGISEDDIVKKLRIVLHENKYKVRRIILVALPKVIRKKQKKEDKTNLKECHFCKLEHRTDKERTEYEITSMAR